MNTNTTILNTLKKEIEAAGIYTGYQGSFFEKTIELLKANIREEENAKNGAKKPYKIIEKMIKDTQKKGSGRQNPAFAKAHKYSGGYGFLDGYRLFFSDNSMGYEVAEPEHTFKIDDMIESNDRYTITPDRIKIDISELKYFIKVSKPGRYESQAPYVIRTRDGFAGYNPHYLLDLLEYSETDTILYFKRKALIYSDNKKGLLLPVNIAWAENDDAENTYNSYREKYFDVKGVAA